MENIVEDVVIVGGGIAGLATSLGLHRLGIRSLVLESSDCLKSVGFAFTAYTNAWRALDALGVGHTLRAKHKSLKGFVITSAITGLPISRLSCSDLMGYHEMRCINRNVLLLTFENELPKGTIRYSSKVVHIQDDGLLKSLHLADGTILKTKVLIGCDGGNSMVARFLGFSDPFYVGRWAIRGIVHFEDGHGLEPNFSLFDGEGVKFGVVQIDDHSFHWFLSFKPSDKDKNMLEDPAKMKHYVLSHIGNVSKTIRSVFENTDLNNIVCTPLRSRKPWELLWGNISKNNICVAGDALHPMTPDMGQGACSSLEDAVVLARSLAEGLVMEKYSSGIYNNNNKEVNDDEHLKTRKGLENFVKERRWRSFDLVTTAYFAGLIQQRDGVVMKFLAKYFFRFVFRKSSFDCGKLTDDLC